MRTSLLVLAGALLWSGCSASYPKDQLHDAIQKLFREELEVECESKLAGKTLYISFPIQGLISENFELSKEVATSLENAMLSISRIALSTNAEIDYTVLEAVDRTWGVRAHLVRRLQDLKDLIYWRISKNDFDERLILEINKEKNADSAGELKASTDSAERWNDLSLPEFMGRWVASRINIGSRSNPFLGVLLGIEKLTPKMEDEGRTLALEVSHYESASSSGTASVSISLIRNTLVEQLSAVEKKYPAGNWVDRVVVRNVRGGTMLEIPREEWLRSQKEKTTQTK